MCSLLFLVKPRSPLIGDSRFKLKLDVNIYLARYLTFIYLANSRFKLKNLSSLMSILTYPDSTYSTQTCRNKERCDRIRIKSFGFFCGCCGGWFFVPRSFGGSVSLLTLFKILTLCFWSSIPLSLYNILFLEFVFGWSNPLWAWLLTEFQCFGCIMFLHPMKIHLLLKPNQRSNQTNSNLLIAYSLQVPCCHITFYLQQKIQKKEETIDVRVPMWMWVHYH